MTGICRNLARAYAEANLDGRANALSRVLRRLRDQRGVMLMEFVVMIGILGLVVGGITSMLVSATKHEAALNLEFQAQESARQALSTLRRDLHNASCVSPTTGTVSTITLTLGLSTAGDCGTGTSWVTWCSVGNAAPYALWRVPAGSCTTSTAGSRKWVPVAAAVGDRPAGLTAATIFTPDATTHPGAPVLPDVAVDFSVTVGNGPAYRLADAIYLRNGMRQ